MGSDLPQSVARDSLSLLGWRFVPLFILTAGLSYWVAFSTRQGAAAVLVALPCIFLLSRLPTARSAFYAGLFCGFAMYTPQLWFFLSIFRGATPVIWGIAALPIAFLVMLVQQSRKHFGETTAMWLTPILWMGVEYFRSELHYLKFSWISPAQAVAFLPGLRWMVIGVYGYGYVCASAAALAIGSRRVHRAIGISLLAVLAMLMYLPPARPIDVVDVPVHVAGIQLEHPFERQAADALDALARAHPEAQILVLSEYSFPGPIPDSVRDVARKHRRYLIAGGVEKVEPDQVRDTAFVIGPDGRDLFQQCKSVPVQFMDDGLAADTRRVWDSPWGKIGIAVCYDIGYARVMDDFVRAGAQGLIIPTMDLAHWGQYEREMLHGRLAPIRSAEYGVPCFGVWSSGESQLTDRAGHLIATAGYPGQHEMIAGPFDMPPDELGHVPIDRDFALCASFGAAGLLLYFIASELHGRWRKAAMKPISTIASL